MADYSLPTRFDPLIHQTSRLAIMAVLAGCEGADFTYLQKTTKLNKGTLSKHLTKLRKAGYVEIEKGFKGNYPHTFIELSSTGRRAFEDYRQQSLTFNRMMQGG